MVETQLCKLRGTSDTFDGRPYSIRSISFIIRYVWCLWTKPTICLLRLSKFHKRSFARALLRMFYPYEGYRSVTPLDAARVNKTTIFHNHSVHWYYKTLIKGGDYIRYVIIVVWHGQQNPQRAVVIVRMILLDNTINRRVVVSLLWTYYYITILRTNTFYIMFFSRSYSYTNSSIYALVVGNTPYGKRHISRTEPVLLQG